MIVGEIITQGPVSGEVGDMPAPRPGLDGDDGWSIQLGRNATHLLVRQVRGEEVTEWSEVVALAELAGPPGAVPVFAVVDGALAYRFGDSGPWGQLITIESLKGNDGLSAYQLWLAAGNVGTVVEFLESLKGESPELPSFVASSTVGVVGSVPTVAAEEVDGEVRFRFVLPTPRDGVSPPPPTLSLSVADAAEGAGSSGSITASGSQWNVSLLLRRGAQGQQGQQGIGGTPWTPLTGTVMPNGVATATPGTLYFDTSTTGGLLGTNGASVWIKASGTGNTGWIVYRGNTGKRDISALLPATLPNTTATGWPTLMWRNGDRVTVAGNSAPTVAGIINVLTLPAGFRQPAADWVGGATGTVVVNGATSGAVWLEANVLKFAGTAAGNHRRWSISWDTWDAWPTGALLGNPVT